MLPQAQLKFVLAIELYYYPLSYNNTIALRIRFRAVTIATFIIQISKAITTRIHFEIPKFS